VYKSSLALGTHTKTRRGSPCTSHAPQQDLNHSCQPEVYGGGSTSLARPDLIRLVRIRNQHCSYLSETAESIIETPDTRSRRPYKSNMQPTHTSATLTLPFHRKIQLNHGEPTVHIFSELDRSLWEQASYNIPRNARYIQMVQQANGSEDSRNSLSEGV
jgi:hypothetical protein